MEYPILVKASSSRIPDSATRYLSVNLTSTDFTSTDGPFKCIILSEPANINIIGLDDESCVIPLQAGINPTSGTGILRASTSVTSLVVGY